MNDHKIYLTQTVPRLLQKLTSYIEPAFGVMTGHHMVEHLIWVTKSSVKDNGAAPELLNDKQLGFMRFIEKGAVFKHRGNKKTREELDSPRTADIQEAINGIPEAIGRLYSANSDRVFYNPMMGKLTFDQMELFHAQHFKYHLEEQFGLQLSKEVQ